MKQNNSWYEIIMIKRTILISSKLYLFCESSRFESFYCEGPELSVSEQWIIRHFFDVINIVKKFSLLSWCIYPLTLKTISQYNRWKKMIYERNGHVSFCVSDLIHFDICVEIFMTCVQECFLKRKKCILSNCRNLKKHRVAYVVTSQRILSF